MATPQESRLYNINEMYPMAGWEIISGRTYLGGTTPTLELSAWLVLTDTTLEPITLRLPSEPYEGKTYLINDDKGTAAANNITINGNGKTINGTATITLSTNYSSRLLRYNGTQWVVLLAA